MTANNTAAESWDRDRDALGTELTDIAVTLARRAGDLMQQRRAAGLSISTKSSTTDLVTDADRAVEQFLVEQLRRLRPDDDVLGEEGGARSSHAPSIDDVHPSPSGVAGAESPDGPAARQPPPTEPIRWVIDPIDGTVNFTLGFPQYAVSIAALSGSLTLAGCVLNPVSGDLFHATLGRGSYLNGQRLSGPRRVPLREAVVATGFSYNRERRAVQGRVVAELMPRIGNLRRAGSAALDLCSVAAGWADCYFETGTHEWDHAAGLLIAEEAAVRTSGLHGRPPGEWMVAAAHADIADDFFAALAELGAALQ